MKTVYDLYFWTHPDAAAKLTRGFASMADAAAHTERTDLDRWQPVAGGDGWLLDPMVTGGKRVWGIFQRQEAENHTEAVQLALELIEADGQSEGAHHKAWVIDQVVRILTGDRYDAWVKEYRDGEDGPETYSWEEGIAP